VDDRCPPPPGVPSAPHKVVSRHYAAYGPFGSWSRPVASVHASMMIGTRVALAGLSPLCEEVLLAGLKERPDIALVSPWTELPLLAGVPSDGTAELLFVEVVDDQLPSVLRVLLAAAEPLRIVGMASDATRATLFTVHERRTILIGPTTERLWRLGSGAD
jgi:hypothetical protein